MKTLPADWRIVLVRPRNPLNIGAAARAMGNFGFWDLVAVEPFGPTWQETRSAVGAEEIVRSARAVRDLQQAIADRTLVIGTTAGSRRNLDRDLVSLAELPAWLAKHARMNRPALLFGSEKTGLSNEHLSYCHALVRIPTAPDCPSMNLGQAVAVCCYELARLGGLSRPGGFARAGAAPGRRGKPRASASEAGHSQPRTRPPAAVHLSDPANLHSLLHIFERAERVLGRVGFLKPKSRAATLLKLRRVLLDLGLTNHDVKILGGVLAQIEWKLDHPA
jgi:tRNA C32,U32 (ribose-2'-O)-methylase TrmJ